MQDPAGTVYSKQQSLRLPVFSGPIAIALNKRALHSALAIDANALLCRSKRFAA